MRYLDGAGQSLEHDDPLLLLVMLCVPYTDQPPIGGRVIGAAMMSFPAILQELLEGRKKAAACWTGGGTSDLKWRADVFESWRYDLKERQVI